MSEFSTTRLADFATAQTNNVNLMPAIQSLQTKTPMSRLSALEVWETLQAATAAGFVITFNSNSVP